MRDNKLISAVCSIVILLSIPLCANASSNSHDYWIDEARQILHTIGGDDFLAFYGFNPDISVVNSHLPVAYISPKNRLILSSGLIDLIESPSEFAFVIAHEVAHEMLGHLNSSCTLSREGHWSLEHEIAADNLAYQLLSKTGFSKDGPVRFLTRLEGFGADLGVSLNSVYPTLSDRRRHMAEKLDRERSISS